MRPTDFLYTAEGRAYLEREYVAHERSIHVIARERRTYPNRVRRALLHHGFALRDKAHAQRAALTSGRSKNPTEGRHRRPEEKIAISEAVAQRWSEISKAERLRRVARAREQWHALSFEAREAMRMAAAEAVRLAARQGSRLERDLYAGLLAAGYQARFHQEHLLAGSESQHIDIYLPRERVAVEVDGPAHFFPIWGEENLEKHLLADAKKAGLLQNAGIRLIRVKNLSSHISDHQSRNLLTNLLEMLQSNRWKNGGELEV